MKKKTLLIIASFLWCILMYSQNVKSVSETNIQNEIIRQCLTFKPLEQKLNTKLYTNDGFVIQNHGIAFEKINQLRVDGKKVVLADKENLRSKNYPIYFLFHTINIESENALVRLNLVTENQKTLTPVTINFKKENNQWIVANYKFER